MAHTVSTSWLLKGGRKAGRVGSTTWLLSEDSTQLSLATSIFRGGDSVVAQAHLHGHTEQSHPPLLGAPCKGPSDGWRGSCT